MYKKLIIFFVLYWSLLACNAHADYEIKVELVQPSCESAYRPVQLTTGPLGERYIWEQCMPEEYAQKIYKISFRQDTIGVDFNKAATKGYPGKNKLFRVTLDVKNDGKYNILQIWSNWWRIEKLRQGSY